MKTCSKCGETKALDGFHKSSSSNDGRHTACKICRTAARRAKYRTDNPKPVSEHPIEDAWLQHLHSRKVV